MHKEITVYLSNDKGEILIEDAYGKVSDIAYSLSVNDPVGVYLIWDEIDDQPAELFFRGVRTIVNRPVMRKLH